MKKTTQKSKKRKGAKKKRNAAEAIEKKQKKDSGAANSDKAVVRVRPLNSGSKKVQERKADSNSKEGGPGRYITKSIQFLRESRTELKKVKWPTRKELFASTAVVIFLVLVVALFLGIVDFGLIKIIKNIIG